MNNTIVLLAVSSAILLYILLLQVARKKSTAKKHRALHVARLPGLTAADFSHCDLVDNRFIGLDKLKRVLVMADLENTVDGIAILPLPDIACCKLEKQTTETVHRGRNREPFEKLLTSISLLLFSAENKLVGRFVFFDQDRNGLKQLASRLQKAERWLKLFKRNGITEIA
ncbi:MAG: hypothetical protein ABW019_03150 [Chitinophagaceae bacterium]